MQEAETPKGSTAWQASPLDHFSSDPLKPTGSFRDQSQAPAEDGRILHTSPQLPDGDT